MRSILLAFFALLFAGAAQAQSAAPANANVVRPDPAVRRGVLPNGLRYAVMRNSLPSNGVSMRLNIGVGSFEETDEERGIAHFLEHMAFNGTKTIPEGELDTVFAGQGVKFGRDQNAATGAFDTTYQLDLSLADKAKLDLGFRWLREVGDGMILSPEAVERERGVVLAEHDRALGPGRTFAEAQAAFLSPELRGPTRWPIGTRPVLQKIDAARLKSFYDRWYRPDNAAVVVVGDVPVEELERRVAETFGSWRARGPAPKRVERRSPDLKRGLDVFARSEPQLPSALSVCRPQAKEPEQPETLARWRRDTPRWLWEAILNERLQRQARAATPPYVSASAGYTEAYREAAYTCLSASPVNEDWRWALGTLLREARRMEAHGVHEAEIRRAVSQRRLAFRTAASQGDTRRTGGLADALINDLSDEDEEVFSRPEENLRLFEASVAGVTPKEVHEAFRRDWAGSGPLVTVRAAKAPSAAEVGSVWNTVLAAAPPPPTVEDVRPAWAYADFGPAGQVVKRETVADPGFTRVTFANGVTMNFKRVAYTKDRVDVSVRLGHGRAGLPYSNVMIPMLGSQLFTAGGLAKHDVGDLSRLFEGRRWGVAFSMDSNWYGLLGSTAPDDVDIQMQILAAYLTDPGFRTNADAKIPTSVETVFRVYRTSPAMMLSLALGEAVAPGGPFGLPAKEDMLKIRSADFERMLRPILTTSPLEVTVVGDVDEAKAIEAVARTIGALPPRTAQPERNPRPPFMTFPAKLPTEVRAVHEGAPEKAIVGVIWPTYVAVPERRREEYALNLLEGIFQDALRRRVREALGKSYSPSVDLSMPDYADQGTLSAMVETSPADVDAVAAEIRKLAADLARPGGVTAQALEEVRRPLLDGRAKERETNGWWLQTLDGSKRRPEWLKDAVEWERMIRSVTREEVQQVASTWLTRPSVTAYATPQGATTARAPAAAAGS